MSEERQTDPRNKPVHVTTVCPHCSEPVEVTVKVCGVPEVGRENVTRVADWRELLTGEEGATLAAAEEAGALDAFKEAAKRILGVHEPRNLDRYFLTWLSRAAPALLPKPELDLLRANFERFGVNGGRIAVSAFQGIGSVSVDGYVRAFIPVLSKTARKPDALNLRATPVQRLEEWVRSRFGYVPTGRGSFSLAMRERSVGDFARLVQ